MVIKLNFFWNLSIRLCRNDFEDSYIQIGSQGVNLRVVLRRNENPFVKIDILVVSLLISNLKKSQKIDFSRKG